MQMFKATMIRVMSYDAEEVGAKILSHILLDAQCKWTAPDVVSPAQVRRFDQAERPDLEEFTYQPSNRVAPYRYPRKWSPRRQD